MSSEQQLVDGFLHRSVDLFAAEVPFYFARGNHETRGDFSDRYLDYFPTSTGETYCMFRVGPVCFVVLDGGEDKPDSDVEYYGLSDFDRFREREAAWLKQVVASEMFRTAPFRVAVIHVPPIDDTWHGPLEVKRLFLPVLNAAGIDLMLCAHLHTYIYNAAGTTECAFPLLVNSDNDCLTLHADRDRLTVIVNDAKHKEHARFVYPAAKR